MGYDAAQRFRHDPENIKSQTKGGRAAGGRRHASSQKVRGQKASLAYPRTRAEGGGGRYSLGPNGTARGARQCGIFFYDATSSCQGCSNSAVGCCMAPSGQPAAGLPMLGLSLKSRCGAHRRCVTPVGRARVLTHPPSLPHWVWAGSRGVARGSRLERQHGRRRRPERDARDARCARHAHARSRCCTTPDCPFIYQSTVGPHSSHLQHPSLPSDTQHPLVLSSSTNTPHLLSHTYYYSYTHYTSHTQSTHLISTHSSLVVSCSLPLPLPHTERLVQTLTLHSCRPRLHPGGTTTRTRSPSSSTTTAQTRHSGLWQPRLPRRAPVSPSPR